MSMQEIDTYDGCEMVRNKHGNLKSAKETRAGSVLCRGTAERQLDGAYSVRYDVAKSMCGVRYVNVKVGGMHVE